VSPAAVGCAPYAISGDRWPDDVRLSDIEARFVCGPAASAARTCGHFRAVQGLRYYGQKGLDA